MISLYLYKIQLLCIAFSIPVTVAPLILSPTFMSFIGVVVPSSMSRGVFSSKHNAHIGHINNLTNGPPTRQATHIITKTISITI